MRLKGLDELNKHLSELNTTGGKLKFAFRFLFIFSLVTIYFILTDQIPTWTLDSQIVIVAIGFPSVSRVFTQKNRLLEKYGEQAYNQAVWKYALPGLAMLLAAVAHIGCGIYPITFSLLVPLGFFGWIRLVEEKELLERIPTYSEYRKHTPAFWANPRNFELFWKFIFIGK